MDRSAFFLQRSATMRTLVVLLITVTLAACKGDDNQPKGEAKGPTAQSPAASAPRPVYPEPEAVQILQAIDSARIASARAARERSQNDAILEYARVMIADHRAIRRVLDSLMTATGQTASDNSLSEEIRVANEHFITELMARDTGFNNAYIAQEINDLERALVLLDTALIPSARNAQVKTTMEQLRPAFEAHLQRAQQIRAAREAYAARAAAAPRPAPVVTPTPTVVVPPPDTMVPPPTTTTM
jgi:putative membrane protein